MNTIGTEQAAAIETEIKRHALPNDFLSVVENYYLPLVSKIIERSSTQSISEPLLLGIQGTQGSGKSTCAAFMKLLFEICYGKTVLVMSIDDFYLTRAERHLLANSVHPLLETRGVPGTHDMALLGNVLDACTQQGNNSFTIPTFNKATDDRNEPDKWQKISKAVDIVILEGWCVGLISQEESDLSTPINELEALEDADLHWRQYVNKRLAEEYAELYARFDYLIALQAPSFECVYNWRLLQEEKLKQKLLDSGVDIEKVKLQSPQELKRFISHYERLTRHALATMPEQADWLLMLKTDHGFSELVTRTKTT